MHLEKYITDLLYRYECVIIPGLGAFLTQNQSARIDAAHNFYPPNKSLAFNQQLQTNDGLLANYIAVVDKCTFEIALEKIRRYTKLVKQDLHEGKEFAIENIGSLSLNGQKAIVFSPANSLNFLTDSFGLSSYTSAEINRTTKKEPYEKPVILFTPEKRVAIPYGKYAAIGLLVLGLSGFGGMYYFSSQVHAHNLAEKQKATSIVEDQIQQATFVIDNPLPSLLVSVKKPIGNFHIIAGAFREEVNALTKIAQLKEKGFPARSLGENRFGLHQVVYSSHQEKEDALSVLRNVQRTENADAWLLVQEID
ncbi:MAG: SPOR domain-containing protein [Flavobacteriales bacterium]|jgi:nucleoid DNA-binding protein|nr:SPOR domain-containing protein [Flavobacteriales bacterium]